MLDVLTGFVEELRSSGLPVSLTESLNATQALRHVDLGERQAVHAALSATLVKDYAHAPAFERVFEIYFSGIASPRLDDGELLASGDESPSALRTEGGAPDGSRPDPARIEALVKEALSSIDRNRRAAIGALMVSVFAGISPDRPVGVNYYLYRTLRAMNLDGVLEMIIGNPSVADDGVAQATEHLGSIGERLVRDEYEARAEELRKFVESEIRRRLAEARGVESQLESARRPLIEDVDFLHATRAELVTMRRALAPLAKRLGARLVRKRRHLGKGSLDFRATIRSSLSSGGVPISPRFRAPHHPKPEIFVLADVSGSVASFARFTLHMVYALSEQFSKVRSFAFIDGLDEVSAMFDRASSITEAVEAIARHAGVTHLDGHSDYGHAFEIFRERFAREVTARTNVIILGDARNNYHQSNAAVLDEIAAKARRLYWLNPEPQAYWGSGDSIISDYAPHCDGVFECRNLRQLEQFVDQLG